MFGATALLAALAFTFTGTTALAASPQDICNDLQDGKIDGTYTAAEWTDFLRNATVQGYCSPVVIVTPPVTVTTTVTGSTPAAPAPTETPPAGSTPAPSPPAEQPQAVPLTPAAPAAPVAGVAAQRKTIVAKAKPARAAVKVTPTRATAAPASATRTSGALPFTGAELALFAVVGLALIGCGLLLRTTARHRSQM
jgi:hypothetical protein